MIPNNNLSVLPWYTSIEQQNARKWWIYNRVYPLYTPAMFLLPFQIIREPLHDSLPFDFYNNECPVADGTQYIHSGLGTSVYEFTTADPRVLLLYNIPAAPVVSGTNTVMGIAFDSNNNVVSIFNPITTGTYTGQWQLPSNAVRVDVLTKNTAISAESGIVSNKNQPAKNIERLKIYKKTGELVTTLSYSQITPYFSVKSFEVGSAVYDVIVFPGQSALFSQFENGEYYGELTDGINTWYSEIFTVVNDIQPYLKITWWDIDDFTMDAGTIVYKNPSFKNVLYLQSDLAKPEYPFEEEGEIRDGYFFPTKQISEKRYRFNFLASEYLLDVIRFIRMADFAEIEYHGQRYSLDTFLITPEWEDNGDVAAVEAEFETATVAKKIGLGYIRAQRGDYNDDFNNDFNNN